MPVSKGGVSNYANTTDGRAQQVNALAIAGNAVGGKFVSVTFGNLPGAIAHILTQNNDLLAAQDNSQIIAG